MLTIVIETPGDNQRKQHFLNQLKEQEISDITFFPAIMDSKMSRRGISRSHKGCIQIAKDRGLPWVNVFEDDVLFLQKGAYKRFLDIFVTEVPKDADMYFGGGYDSIFTPITPRLAANTGKHAGMMNYIVQEHFYDKFLEADERYNIDHFLTAPDLTNAKCYTAYPMLSLQVDGRSYNTGMMTEYNPEMHKRFTLWDGVG